MEKNTKVCYAKIALASSVIASVVTIPPSIEMYDLFEQDVKRYERGEISAEPKVRDYCDLGDIFQWWADRFR